MAPEAAPPADTAKPIPVAEADDDVPVGPDKYGNFSDPGSFNVGVPYTGKDPLAQGNTRLRGVNMKAPSARSCKGNDAAFDRLKPLYQKEPFQVSAKEKREARAKAEAGRIQGPLVPAGMPKKSSGLGGYGGTLGEPFENEDGEPFHGWGTADGDPPKGLRKGDPSTQPKPRNIVTAPGKKGSYGTRGQTLGEKKGAGGSAGEYKYVTTDYDAERKADAARAAHGKKLMSGKPDWRPTAPAKRGGAGVTGKTLSGPKNLGGVCGEYKYKPEGPDPKFVPEPPAEYPWAPPKPNKGPMNPFPEHMADPEELQRWKERRRDKEGSAKITKQWRPGGGGKSGATKSVLRMNTRL